MLQSFLILKMVSYVYNGDLSDPDQLASWFESPVRMSFHVQVNAHEKEKEWTPASATYDYKKMISIKKKNELKQQDGPKTFAEFHNNYGLGFDMNGQPL